MIKPEDGDAVEIELKHRMIILCENESGGDMRKVLDAGV